MMLSVKVNGVVDGRSGAVWLLPCLEGLLFLHSMCMLVQLFAEERFFHTASR
jgi:hypothetical protein